jgi:anti-sigma B factor antagonist
MDVTRTEVGEHRVVITVDGELDLATAPLLRAALEGVESNGHRPMTIDFAACSFVDSTGIGVILDAGRRLNGTTKLRIANLRGQPKQVFELTQTDRVPYLEVSVEDDDTQQ